MFSGWTPRYGGASGYPAAPAADSGLQSFRDQHLAQLEQLQRMHQRQMESVLPVGSPVPPRPYFPPRQTYPYPPPYSHNVPPPGYQPLAPPPDSDKPPPPPPTTDHPPPPPPPDGGPPTSSTSLEEQQQYWYNQHLLNLQQKAESQAPPPVLETAGPPPPPVEEAKPPLPADNAASGINLSEDPEQAQRLKTLQEAAAHWQQHEHHRLGFQYQGIMQKHGAMQQLLQRYQQIVQDPPHLAAMTVDVQLQHYELQQKQFLLLHLEWENQFKKWQELLQTYPHKDQLQEYQVQWASWQTHIKATKTHLKDKVASLKNLKQQFGGSHYIGGIALVPQYPAYPPVIPPAFPAALPTGVSVQPPFTPPVPPVYGPGPPPSLPPVSTYSEATPPPPVTAPPLPPAAIAPPPPPPVASPSTEAVQPPLPPATEITPPVPTVISAPDPVIPPPVPSPSAPIIPPPVVSSAPPTVPSAGIDPPPPAPSFIPGNKILLAGLSYQAQQALKNAKAPPGQMDGPGPSYNPPSDIPTPELANQSEDPKNMNPPGPTPILDREPTSTTVLALPASLKPGGPYEVPPEPRFSAQGLGFAPPRFPPPPLGSHGSRPIHDRENPQWTIEQKDPSTPADTSKQFMEGSDRVAPASRWDRPKENSDQSWDRPKPPPASQAPPAKEMSDYPPGPMADREPNLSAEKWSRPDGPPFNRRNTQGDNLGNKWDQPPEGKWSDSKEPTSDRWSNSQDRWDVENTASTLDRFGDGQNSGANRFGTPEVGPYQRYADGMGPSYDHHAAPEAPFRGRFGHLDGSRRFRFNSPDFQPRGRARFPTAPPPGRFLFPESHPRHRFGAPEVRPPSFCYPETPSRDRFGGPDLPSAQEHKEGSEKLPSEDHIRGSEQPTSKERFRDSEHPSYQEGPRDFKMPPPHHPFGTPDTPCHDRFGGPEVPQAHDCFESPDAVDLHKGSELPPPPGDCFRGLTMPPPAPEGCFVVPDMPSTQQKRFGDCHGPVQDNWSPANKERVDAPDDSSRDSCVPFGDSWDSEERKGAQEWSWRRGDKGNRPSLLGDSPPGKPEKEGNTENVPNKSYQSQFNKKQMPKEDEAHIGDGLLSGGQKEAKQEPQDVEMKQVDEPTEEGALKTESQDVPKPESSASCEPQKAEESADSSEEKTKTSDLPEMDPLSDQTLLIASKANEPSPASAVSSGASKDPGPASTPDKREVDMPGLDKPSAPETAKPDAPIVAVSVAIKSEEVADSPSSLRKPDNFQISYNKPGGLLPTPTTGINVPFALHTTPFRPRGPHSLPPVRPGDPWAPPVRPGDPWAPPVRPGEPWAPPVRPDDPWAPSVRPGAPMALPPVRMGGPRAVPPVRMGGPRAAPPIRMGGPRVAPPCGPRAATPVRPGGPRAVHPVRPFGPRAHPPVRPGAPGVPYSPWEQPPERVVQGEDRTVYSASMAADAMYEDPYDEADEDLMEENQLHGPEGRHGRAEFHTEEADDSDYFHHEPGRLGGFREDDASLEPEPYTEDWPENYDMRFDHRGRGRGFMRGRPPPRLANREMDGLDDRGFDPRGHLPDERPLFREGMNEPPPFGRDAFLREPRFADRERFSPPLEVRRRDFALEEGRLDNWERERYWRARNLDLLRDPYMRDERVPLRPPPLPHDVDVRHEPWYDHYPDKDMDRVLNYNRLERPYLCEREDRDHPRIPEDLELPLRERDWLPERRPLSPHPRPYSPVRARSPLPPLPPIDRYLDDRWRLDRDLADRDFRDRGELRIREYPERPLWHEDRNPDLLPGRSELESKDGRWYPTEQRAECEGPLPPPVDTNTVALPDQSPLPGGESGTAGVLALSQRQHEIILKAAQELKMLREQKEQLDNLKHFFGDPEPSDGLGKLAVRSNVPPSDKPSSEGHLSSGAAPLTGGPFSDLWEEERRGAHSSGLPIGSKLSGIQQTVDYAHGRDLAIGKVEQTPYGERVMLLPDPAVDRGGVLPYQKDFLIDSFDRDFRDRDPYYKSVDRRDYERDRSDAHRDRTEHDRDRHSRDERSSYRDKETSSRRGASDRKADRLPYDLPPYGGSRRSYQEERSVIPPPMAAPPPEKKPETKNVDDLLKRPGRESRPDRIVVIMRGLPGSGKTHVAKLIRDREVEFGGSAPRVLSLDDYFITEVEKVEKDPETGKKVKRKVMEYEYEVEMEESYRSGMLKTFKKTLDDGFFPFIILDSIHDRVRHYEPFWSAAKTKGFEVYLAEISADSQTCAKRNVHGRKLKDINKMAENWEAAPRHMIRLDIRSLLQDAAIEEVEMEDSEPSLEPHKEEKKEAAEEDDNDRGYLPKSKWEMDTSEAKLDKLDGLKVKKRKRDYGSAARRMEDYLQLPDDYDSRESEPGKKRVRWADLEEKKDAERKRAIGFVVGQTDWEKITDKSGHLAERALNRTKYI